MKGRSESGEIEKGVVRLVDGESWWIGRRGSQTGREGVKKEVRLNGCWRGKWVERSLGW